jgi:hypothetical protein
MISISQCFIEVYPFEGTPYAISSPNILAVTTSRNIREPAGSFSLSLRPGGPGGVDAIPTWTQIITPMSLVLIGMRRGTHSQIVMIGLVSATAEDQVWQTGRGAQRATVVSGGDFGYYFSLMNYYSLGFLGMTAGAVAGEGSLLHTAVAFPSILTGNAYQFGPPDQIGLAFYNNIMVGPDGLLANSFVPYQNNARIHIRDVIGTFVEKFYDLIIPNNSVFITTEGSWLSKFFNLFMFPVYEFFVTTAPLNYYGTASGQSAGYSFTMKSMPEAKASAPVMVARLNPTPTFTTTSNGFNQAFKLTGMDMSRWSALPVFTPEAGFIQSHVGFSMDEVRNFYILNPVAMRSLTGDTNTQTNIFAFSTYGMVDPASVVRYGYRPEITATDYFSDPNGLYAQKGTVDASQTLSVILARIAAHYHPTQFMARAEVTLPLRPDIMIGNVFRYAPFKGQPTWDFYIEGISHVFDFEHAQSVTTLNLSRGLPSSIYADSSSAGLLMSVHTGNAQRVDGVYEAGLPAGTGPALESFTPGPQINQFLGQISPGFTQPQF